MGNHKKETTCGTCRYRMDGGECYRFPPAKSPHGGWSEHPVVRETDFCAEWMSEKVFREMYRSLR